MQDIIFNVTCDNHLKVWVDGVHYPSVLDDSWPDVSTVTIPAGSEVIALSCRDYDGVARGILGSSNTGIVTNQVNWVCSRDEEVGWQTTSFDDSSWINPTSYSIYGSPLYNGAGPWGWVAGVDGSAEWVWLGSSTSSAGGAKKIWCRHHISKFRFFVLIMYHQSYLYILNNFLFLSSSVKFSNF